MRNEPYDADVCHGDLETAVDRLPSRLSIADDLLDVGVQVLNLQDTVNGIDWIEANLEGRACIDMDLDRRTMTRFGTPAQIDEPVGHAVKKLSSAEGGLMLKYDLLPGAPLENISVLMDAMAKRAQHFS